MMKSLNFKHAFISSIVVYSIGIAVLAGSFYVPLMENPELQANLALMIAIIPAAIFGARLYYLKGHKTHGLALGALMFAAAIILDAIITVPVFIMPNGGDHISFFGDPGFWLIGVEYVFAVVFYSKYKLVNMKKTAAT